MLAHRVTLHLTIIMRFFLSTCVNSYLGDKATHLWWHADNVKNLSNCHEVWTGPYMYYARLGHLYQVRTQVKKHPLRATIPRAFLPITLQYPQPIWFHRASLMSEWNCRNILKDYSAADTGFPVGGGANSWGGTNIQTSWIFPKNCMKSRKFWSMRGHAPGVPPWIRHCYW